LILKNIGRLENISATEEETAARIGLIAQSRGMTAEALRESLEKDDLLDHIEYEVLNQKVFDFIESKARIRTVKRDRPAVGEDRP
jgi:FKBP-type peptidyl-prolyl cis-trans isomerase (trigger factor)